MQKSCCGVPVPRSIVEGWGRCTSRDPYVKVLWSTSYQPYPSSTRHIYVSATLLVRVTSQLHCANKDGVRCSSNSTVCIVFVDFPKVYVGKSIIINLERTDGLMVFGSSCEDDPEKPKNRSTGIQALNTYTIH